MNVSWGAWVAQPVKHPTLDFGSGHDLTVGEFEPCIRSRVRTGRLPGILSLPSLCPSSACGALSVSLSLSNGMYLVKLLVFRWVELLAGSTCAYTPWV